MKAPNVHDVARNMPEGTWVASFHSETLDLGARIGRVRWVYDDGSLDIVLYSKTGARIGRESPSMGGPKGFEPYCCADNWEPIEKPDFDSIANVGFYARHLVRLRRNRTEEKSNE